eukprot:CAMPEP_0206559092 /NCGR_PEP_ID=MMETSP0325_2-20121206/20174_1 /ASSEMBLY_ACC=CAM_ASM_000347 /TAXON_ID=2866 /ORGANISM="Crypthecodinium cohnii, Strain Seligo" /LENGTH=503 /DNA_ID=CAMNT_0054060499 /DNA_START=282 /DNA_END=1793 /DNA_ORIENTATION=+
MAIVPRIFLITATLWPVASAVSLTSKADVKVATSESAAEVGSTVMRREANIGREPEAAEAIWPSERSTLSEVASNAAKDSSNSSADLASHSSIGEKKAPEKLQQQQQQQQSQQQSQSDEALEETELHDHDHELEDFDEEGQLLQAVKIQAAPILKLGTGGGGAGSAGTDRTSTTGGTDVDGRTSVRAAPAARRANKEQEVSQACPESWRPARRAQKVQSVQRAPGGYKGQEGEMGAPGADGLDGEVGDNGTEGPIGYRGDRGPTGPQGNPGPDGKAGKAGRQGKPGPPGIDGPAGPKGDKGQDGIKGIKGRTGPRGLPGVKGEKGDAGHDATIPNPVNCTWSEWLSWEDCTRSCGGGRHRRERYIKVYAMDGGRVCNGVSMEYTSCSMAPCPVKVRDPFTSREQSPAELAAVAMELESNQWGALDTAAEALLGTLPFARRSEKLRGKEALGILGLTLMLFSVFGLAVLFLTSGTVLYYYATGKIDPKKVGHHWRVKNFWRTAG